MTFLRESKLLPGSGRTNRTSPADAAVSSSAQGETIFRKASCSCGGGCPSCQSSSGSLRISQPNDTDEIEADAIADRVMRMPVNETDSKRTDESDLTRHPSNRPQNAVGNDRINRKCSACATDDEEAAKIQRKESRPGSPSEPGSVGAPPSINSVISAGGHPLDRSTRNFFEPRFGMDLGHVRVHADSAAARSASAIDARAYTLGNNIVFGRGEYDPGTESGRHLIAHELAHVGQQRPSPSARRVSADNVIRRKGGSNAESAKIKLLSYEEAAAVLGDEIHPGIDESSSAMTSIGKTLEMPFTNDNARLRIRRLVAAISLLDERDAIVVYRALTTPENDKQKHLKERFGRFSDLSSKPLLDLLQQKAKSSPKTAATPRDVQPKYQEGKATWVEMHPGVFGYVPEPGMNLKKVAAYVSGNPNLPAGLSKLNNNIGVDQVLETGRPVIIPVELIDQDRAIGEMSQETRKKIGSVVQAKANAANVERMIRVKPGPLGPGMYGPFPVTGMAGSVAVDVVRAAVEALWKILKGAGYLIAFAGGVVHGFFASLWDTVSGIAKMIYDLVDSIISGEIFDDIKKFIDGMKKITIDNVKDMIGDWAMEWHKKLTSDSVWVAGHAHGYLTGYVMAEAAMLLLTGGATAELKAAFWASRIGKMLRTSAVFVAAEKKVATLVEAGGKLGEVVEKLRESRVGKAVKAVETVVEVAGWTAEKIGKVLSLPGDIAVFVIDKALQNAKKLGPFFDRIGKLTLRAKKWLFGCASPCVWDPETLARLMKSLSDEEIEIVCKATNQADLTKGKWFEKSVKVGDKLPEGYHWREGDIVRGPGKRQAEYAPLSYDKQAKQIKVGISGERISNPSVMNKNYKEQVRQRIKESYKGRKLSDKELDAKVAKEISEHAVHHLIPDNLVQDHPLGKAARKAGYDLDRGSNLKGLQKNQGLTDPDLGDIGHWSSHPKYDKLVEDELTRVQRALEKEFKSLDNVPKNRMLDEMKKIEDKFRNLFDKGTVPIDPNTGRLVEVTPGKAEEEEEEKAYA